MRSKVINQKSKVKSIIISITICYMLFAISYSYAQVRSIREVRTVDNNGIPLFLDSTVIFTGIVTVANQFSSSGPAFIYDNTAGVAVYNTLVSQMVIGDSVTIRGLVTNYNGLIEITNISLTKNASGKPVTPILMTIPEISRLDTSYVGNDTGYVENEGKLILLKHVFFLDTTGLFNGNTNYTLRDTFNNACQVRIGSGVSTLVGLPIPNDTFDLVSVISQYDNTPPYFGGYQIMPRSINDLGLSFDDTLPLITIAEVQTPGADGYSSYYEGQTVKVKGRVTGPLNIFSSTYPGLYIQDATNGVNVFRPTYFTGFEHLLNIVGSEWYCTGTVTEYNGLTEIADGTLWISDTNIVDVASQELPYNTAVSEGMESKLIQVTGSVTTEPAGAGAGQNFTLKNGIPGVTIRILDATGIPINQFKKNKRFRINGIVGQYTSTAPFNVGYQVMPRFASDVVDLSDSIPASEAMRFDTIYPNSFSTTDADPLLQYARIKINSPSDYKLYLEIFDMKGRLVKRLMTNQPGGFYEIIWDGTDDKFVPCPIGIYILNLKGITAQGKDVLVSKPIVIATKL